MGIKKVTICHKRNDCIGCGSCALLAPQTWSMNKEDGKSDMKDAKWKGKEFMVAKLDDEEYIIRANKKAEEACPVRVIRLADSKN